MGRKGAGEGRTEGVRRSGGAHGGGHPPVSTPATVTRSPLSRVRERLPTRLQPLGAELLAGSTRRRGLEGRGVAPCARHLAELEALGRPSWLLEALERSRGVRYPRAVVLAAVGEEALRLAARRWEGRQAADARLAWVVGRAVDGRPWTRGRVRSVAAESRALRAHPELWDAAREGRVPWRAAVDAARSAAIVASQAGGRVALALERAAERRVVLPSSLGADWLAAVVVAAEWEGAPVPAGSREQVALVVRALRGLYARSTRPVR